MTLVSGRSFVPVRKHEWDILRHAIVFPAQNWCPKHLAQSSTMASSILPRLSRSSSSGRLFLACCKSSHPVLGRRDRNRMSALEPLGRRESALGRISGLL